MQTTRRSHSDVCKYKVVQLAGDVEGPDIPPITTPPAKGKPQAKIEPDKPVENLAAKPRAKSELDKPVETLTAKPRAKSELDKPVETLVTKPRAKSELDKPVETLAAKPRAKSELDKPVETLTAKPRAKSELDKPVETLTAKPRAKSELDKPVETLTAKPRAKSELDKPVETLAAKPRVKSEQVERHTSTHQSQTHQRRASGPFGRDHLTQIPKPSPQPAPPSPKRHSKAEPAFKSVPVTASSSSGKGNATPRQGSLESGLQNSTCTNKRSPSDDSLEDTQSLKPKTSPNAVSPVSPQTGKSLSSAAMVAKQPAVGMQMAAGKSKLPVPVSSLHSQGAQGATLQHTEVKTTQAQNLAARTEKALKTRLYLMQKTGPATFMVSGDNVENKYRVVIGPQVSSF